MKLIVTIDVEEDSGPNWVSPPTSSFRGVTVGLKDRLQPLFRDLGVRPTLMISPIVLHDIESAEVLGQLEGVELGAHLHWEQIAPRAERTLQGGPGLLKHMQWDFPPEAEREKLEALTELFYQRLGFRPTSFRAGRYGASRSTGAILKELGYEVDTSATPHVRWTTPNNGLVDYLDTPEQPYYIAPPGNIYQRGDFDFLEVPITILAPDKIPGLNQAPWFRPAYSSLPLLKEIVKTVHERNSAGIEQPLVMMFHNVEVIPNASPYTKTEDDVRAYMNDIRATLQYAIESGFEPCTLTEYARGFKPGREKVRPPEQSRQTIYAKEEIVDNGIGIPLGDVRRVVDRYNVPPWHLYIYKDRNTRWDVIAISEWVKTNMPKNADILSVGCGMAFNLYWWSRQGFTNLNGFDRDESAISASKELIERFNLPIRLWVDEAQNEEHSFHDHFDYIEAMNCLMYEDGLYPRFLKAYVKALKPLGYLALDTIDESYNRVPDNQWLTSDRHKPVSERAPSEYKVRPSEKEVFDMAARHGLTPIAMIKARQQVIPRIIYIFRKVPVLNGADQPDLPEHKTTSQNTEKTNMEIL